MIPRARGSLPLTSIGVDGARKRAIFRFNLPLAGCIAALCIHTQMTLPVPLHDIYGHTNHQIEKNLRHPTEQIEPEVIQPKMLALTKHKVLPGDTLGAIFAQQEISHAVLNAILAADQEILALDILRPGTRLVFEYTETTGDLARFSLALHPGHMIHYRRTIDGHFEFEEEITPSRWQQEVISTFIQGSFYASAKKAGLNDSEIVRAQRILEERVNFRRDIRAGNQLKIVLGREIIDTGTTTGRTRIEAIQLQLGNRVQSAFLHGNGNYYDDQGESLNRAFLRYPMQGNYRISSHFSLHRIHPVTGRAAPHHGVDFAMPIGTPILSIGDGIVSQVGNHPFAGKYIEIDHPGQFKTRYLHLSRIDVRRGQRINRGDRVALSGNTGRSTGPHLHFELHVNNRPVDPLKADIPVASRVPEEDMETFSRRVTALASIMKGGQTQVASRKILEAEREDI